MQEKQIKRTANLEECERHLRELEVVGMEPILAGTAYWGIAEGEFANAVSAEKDPRRKEQMLKKYEELALSTKDLSREMREQTLLEEIRKWKAVPDWDFKDLLAKHKIDPQDVLVLRHTPTVPRLRDAFLRLAAVHPDVFNAYQQTQREGVENEMKNVTYVASFIGHAPASALFIGLYQRHGQDLRTPDQIRSEPAVQVLESYGCGAETRSRLWFDLRLREDFFGNWKGKLTIEWPGKAINWHRRADKAEFKITVIHEESLLSEQPPASYRKWDLRWDQLKLLSESSKARLRGWCGIYYIFDISDGRGYVGKASGAHNLLGRWRNYGDTGDGGNLKLRGRDPLNFRFSILELIPGDMEDGDVEQREQNWMVRLRTRTRTHGLNLPELDY